MITSSPVETSLPPAAPDWVGQALQTRDFLLSSWPWRGVTRVAASIVTLSLTSILLLIALAPVVVALDSPRRDAEFLPLLALTVPLAGGLMTVLAPHVTRVDMWLTRIIDRRPRPEIVEPKGFRARWRYRLTQRSAWLRVAYMTSAALFALVMLPIVTTVAGLSVILLLAPLLIDRGLGPIALGPWQVATSGQAWSVVLPGALVALIWFYMCGVVATGQAALVRLLLVNREGPLQQELTTIIDSRARLAHDFDDERRRIERDLHDGAQQRVVSLAMQLGMARMDLQAQLGDAHEATRLVSAAHEQAKTLLKELRDFVRGIHPQVLTDVGLGAAVAQLAAALPIPVETHDLLTTRPARHVESTLYFCTTEAVNNAVRHSGASQVTITLRRDLGQVVVEVCDNGCGGADPERGTGLRGMANRAAVLDGTLSVTSPPGGPTLVRMSVPDTPNHSPGHAT